MLGHIFLAAIGFQLLTLNMLSIYRDEFMTMSVVADFDVRPLFYIFMLIDCNAIFSGKFFESLHNQPQNGSLS